MRIRPPFTIAAIFVALPLSAAPLSAWAQTDANRYGVWTPPGAASGANQNQETQALVKELNALILDAEQSRAANPAFLRDLKALSARYAGQGGGARVLFDDFSDGDFQRNPAWSVTSGEYWVEQGYGLRSKVVEAAATGNGSAPMSKEQMAMSILGAVLQGANKNAPAAPAPAAPAKPSAIETRARIANVFEATLEMSSWQAAGVFALAMNQGLGGAGYRLEYTAGPGAKLELVRATANGRSVIDSKAITALEDKKIHRVQWIRAADGAMSVSIDDKMVLSARDTSFRDAFDGVELSSHGADVIVKSVSVAGAR